MLKLLRIYDCNNCICPCIIFPSMGFIILSKAWVYTCELPTLANECDMASVCLFVCQNKFDL
jgi:hypothetical protein